MYSDKENVNILTALLVAHGVRHAVVCPGSRNAPIVHNLDACPSIECYPVTDERSAGFYALGIALETRRPTVVCVTSGTALLNLASAVAEAYYQHVPLVVVSADRPLQWIDQLDGQTLPQGDALGRFVRKAVTLPMILRDEHLMVATRATPTEEPEPLKRRQEISWYCNRLVNEALLAAKQDGGGPVHINVPLDRPLYNFTTPELPQERKIELLSSCRVVDVGPMLQQLYSAKRPVIVIGQLRKQEISENVIDQLVKHRYVVLQETLSGVYAHNIPFRGVEELERLSEKEDAVVYPDFILYVGRTLVSQKLKQYLRDAKNAVCWRVDERGEIADTFMNLTGVIQAKAADVLKAIDKDAPIDWHYAWENIQLNAVSILNRCNPQYSSMLAVEKLEKIIGGQDVEVHYANSMAVRYGCLFAKHHILCNRGVNGIDGSLSTAAGSSLVSDKNVYCIIGDLSFFYDRNALWNRNLRGNLRILLLNNGGGGIFEKFSEHLQDEEDARNVMAQHYTSAEGFCADNHIEYHYADDEASLESGLISLTREDGNDRPIVLEIKTNAEEDWKNYQIIK